jgi:NaMN:DMB phosphoribosyltransferase
MELFGDPMMPVNTGIAIGAMKKVPVIFGGGTQMAPVMAAVLKLDPSLIGNMVQGTTRWLLADPNSNMVKIAESISPEIPIVSINMDYSDTPYEGLQAYEWGYIKEGVGCGGSCVAAVASSSGAIGCREILERVESIYEKLVKH